MAFACFGWHFWKLRLLGPLLKELQLKGGEENIGDMRRKENNVAGRGKWDGAG